MSLESLHNELVSLDVPLSQIYLDPNNPRFVGANWTFVPDEEATNDAIQDDARLRMVREYGAEKLKQNMEVNGYLPIDRIIIRKLTDESFVVLEGNRRVTAAKMISKYATDGTEITDEVLDSLKVIPCLQYVGSNTNAAWIFQGLRHITGINDWSSFNKAKLLVEQMDEDGLDLTTVGKRFGLTAYGAGQWVRGYYAFKQASESTDYTVEVDERSYPYFQELFSRSSVAVREWLEWNDADRMFQNTMNLNEFVGWLYPRPEADGDGEDDEDNDALGQWGSRKLARRDDVRAVAGLINKFPEYFELFRSDGDLERAHSMAMAEKYEQKAREKANAADVVFESIQQCTKALDDAPLRMVKDEQMQVKLFEKLDKLLEVISNIKA